MATYTRLMSNPVAVSGAHGFLGSAVVEHLRGSSDVIPLGRYPGDRAWDLRDTFAPSLGDVVAVIHCAWAVSPRTVTTANFNIAGSLALLDAARAADIPLIFVSSISASDATRSRYGRSKRAVERPVLAYERGVVLRPGTIRDASGGIGMLSESLGRLADLPLEARVSPSPYVPLVSLNRVVEAISKRLTNSTAVPREVDLVDEWLPLEALMASLTERASRPTVRIPSGVVTGASVALQRASIPPFRDLADSWLGLMDASARRPLHHQ
jgi:nucleoside-diphosphate-sugar epimerase